MIEASDRDIQTNLDFRIRMKICLQFIVVFACEDDSVSSSVLLVCQQLLFDQSGY